MSLQLPAGSPIGLIVGADSLAGRRSGVGRMTLEIIEAVRNRPEIGGLRLLMAGHLHRAEPVLAAMNGEPLPPPPPVRTGLFMRAKQLVAGVPGVQRLRGVKRRLTAGADLRDLRNAGAGTVYHEPNMIPQPFGGPTVITVNDLSWFHHPEYHPQDRLDWIDRNITRALADASRFVAISNFTAAAMTRELGVASERIDVVPLAAGAQFAPIDAEAAAPILAAYGLQDRSYVLSVSTLEPRKNFDRLVAAHLTLPDALRHRAPLVIVGGSGWGTTLASPRAERARQEGTLRLLGHVDDAGLVALYARAAVFAYVSIYEGFGLPVIEAMASGTPVLASSTTATGETAGDAAILVDPEDVDAIATGLRTLLEDPDLAASLATKGLARAACFTWDHTASALIRTWRAALA